jgi:hypothetical protein
LSVHLAVAQVAAHFVVDRNPGSFGALLRG